jgi:predicted dehydrogenase
MICDKIWLVGTGYMALEYAKVLKNLNVEFIVIGRNEYRCEEFQKVTGIKPLIGGLELYLKTNPQLPNAVINATGIESLASSTNLLLDFGIKHILLEKPGGGDPNEIRELVQKVKEKNAKVLLAYNRRFYSSVITLKELIDKDGGVTSFFFEFTEWSHQIRNLDKHKIEHENWFLGNSTHVIDTAFYLCGKPVELKTFYKGGNDWHPSATIFSGAGITNKSALFSYIANWESPGRWNLEVMTKNHRYVMKPMEKLYCMDIGSVSLYEIEVQNKLDIDFKPGVFLQTKYFLEKKFEDFCSMEEQFEMLKDHYLNISNYQFQNK